MAYAAFSTNHKRFPATAAPPGPSPYPPIRQRRPRRSRRRLGDADDVNRVQLDIRLGHSKTVENAMKMLLDDGPLAGVTVCDAGCGTGSLTIPLAKEGAVVFAGDISAAVVTEAERQAEAEAGADDAQVRGEGLGKLGREVRHGGVLGRADTLPVSG